jgi:hypothetical protein
MNTVDNPISEPESALQLFEPDPQTVYTIEATNTLSMCPAGRSNRAWHA